jgi:hypothetical protein
MLPTTDTELHLKKVLVFRNYLRLLHTAKTQIFYGKKISVRSRIISDHMMLMASAAFNNYGNTWMGNVLKDSISLWASIKLHIYCYAATIFFQTLLH